jgi:hypothetical protein
LFGRGDILLGRLLLRLLGGRLPSFRHELRFLLRHLPLILGVRGRGRGGYPIYRSLARQDVDTDQERAEEDQASGSDEAIEPRAALATHDPRSLTHTIHRIKRCADVPVNLCSFFAKREFIFGSTCGPAGFA